MRGDGLVTASPAACRRRRSWCVPAGGTCLRSTSWSMDGPPRAPSLTLPSSSSTMPRRSRKEAQVGYPAFPWQQGCYYNVFLELFAMVHSHNAQVHVQQGSGGWSPLLTTSPHHVDVHTCWHLCLKRGHSGVLCSSSSLSSRQHISHRHASLSLRFLSAPPGAIEALAQGLMTVAGVPHQAPCTCPRQASP